jgi:hypothetical protein
MKMQTLDAPLYELNQESEHYKTLKEVKDSRPFINSILEEIEKEHGFEAGEFVYYGAIGFGFYRSSKNFEEFKKELMKNPDRNGVYMFKKSSKIYKAIHPKMIQITEIEEKVSPFALHDIFGFNNVKASQWVGDRYFVGVKSAERTEQDLDTKQRGERYSVEPVKEIEYKEYLSLIMEALNKE